MRERLRSKHGAAWRFLFVGELLLYTGVLLAFAHALMRGQLARFGLIAAAFVAIGLVMSLAAGRAR